MGNHQMLSRGWAMPVLALALALSSVGCSADMNGGPGEGEGNVGNVVEPVVNFGKDYLFFQTPKTWAQAEAVCESIDSSFKYRLAVPLNATEQNWLHNQEVDEHGGGRWWLGVNDQRTEGTFTPRYNNDPFVGDGSPISFTYWHAGEPNNSGNEDCVMDNYWSDDHGWNDSSCGNTANFICERLYDTNHLPTTQTHPYGTVSNTNNALVNYEGFQVQINAGQTVTIGTCGLPNASASGDTFLRLYAPNGGAQVAFNDDGCYGQDRGSNLSIIAATSGWYNVRAGCYSNDTCSGTVAWTIH